MPRTLTRGLSMKLVLIQHTHTSVKPLRTAVSLLNTVGTVTQRYPSEVNVGLQKTFEPSCTEMGIPFPRTSAMVSGRPQHLELLLSTGRELAHATMTAQMAMRATKYGR